MTPGVTAVIRVVHVLSAAFWFGTMILNGGFLLPAVVAAGPAGGQVMRHMVQARRLPAYLTATVGVALLSGVLLLYSVSAGFSPAFFGSRQGILLGNGMLAAIVAAVIGLLVNGRTAEKLGQVGAQAQAAGGPPKPETVAAIQALQARLALGTRMTAALLVIAIASMSAARYL